MEWLIFAAGFFTAVAVEFLVVVVVFVRMAWRSFKATRNEMKSDG